MLTFLGKLWRHQRFWITRYKVWFLEQVGRIAHGGWPAHSGIKGNGLLKSQNNKSFFSLGQWPTRLGLWNSKQILNLMVPLLFYRMKNSQKQMTEKQETLERRLQSMEDILNDIKLRLTNISWHIHFYPLWTEICFCISVAKLAVSFVLGKNGFDATWAGI